jgi:large subunit ribosomal protein L21
MAKKKVQKDHKREAPKAKVELKDVLAIGSDSGLRVGNPILENVVVEAEVINEGRDKKVITFKKRRRKFSFYQCLE